MTKIKILLIEDNHLLREGIAAMLNGQGEFNVISTSEDGDSLMHMKKVGTPPDVVLLDLGLEKIYSLELMSLLQKELPPTKIIAMDILPDHVDIIEFVKAGGDEFIIKNSPFSVWVDTIKRVADGEKVLPLVMTNTLFSQIVEHAITTGREIKPESIQFTNREREVVNLIAKGLGNKEIAGHLHIATFTVKSHVHNILEKLELNTRLQIAAFVREEGLDKSGTFAV